MIRQTGDRAATYPIHQIHGTLASAMRCSWRLRVGCGESVRGHRCGARVVGSGWWWMRSLFPTHGGNNRASIGHGKGPPADQLLVPHSPRQASGARTVKETTTSWIQPTGFHHLINLARGAGRTATTRANFTDVLPRAPLSGSRRLTINVACCCGEHILQHAAHKDAGKQQRTAERANGVATNSDTTTAEVIAGITRPTPVEAVY